MDPHYDAWNQAIGQDFYSPKHAGQSVFLTVDEVTLWQISEDYGAPLQFASSAQAVDDFVAAVCREICQRGGWTLGVLQPDKHPIFLGFLALQVLAVFKMREDEKWTDRAYWGRLRELLHDPEASYMPLGLNPNQHQRLWRGVMLNECCVMSVVTSHARRSVITCGHVHGCDSSCYDCLRDYNNADLHALLDWRLGLGLARLAVNAQASIDLHTPYWQALAEQAAKGLGRVVGQGAEIELIEEIWTLRDKGGVRAVLTHPLWAPHHPHLRRLVTRLRVETTALPRCTLFDALHRPGWCVSQLGN